MLGEVTKVPAQNKMHGPFTKFERYFIPILSDNIDVPTQNQLAIRGVAHISKECEVSSFFFFSMLDLDIYNK